MTVQFRLGHNHHKVVEDFLSMHPAATSAVTLDSKARLGPSVSMGPPDGSPSQYLDDDAVREFGSGYVLPQVRRMLHAGGRIPDHFRAEYMASLIIASSATVEHPGFKREDEIRYIEAVPALRRKHYRPTDYGDAPYLKVGPAHRVFESSKQLEEKQAGAAKPQNKLTRSEAEPPVRRRPHSLPVMEVRVGPKEPEGAEDQVRDSWRTAESTTCASREARSRSADLPGSWACC